MMNIEIILKFLILLVCANGAPIIASRIFGKKLSTLLDGGVVLNDGFPLLGKSKTVRGIVASLLTTSLVAPVIGISFSKGLIIACLAMLGDIISSFIKRRLGYPPSHRVNGLDQVPESLFPALVGIVLLGFTLLDVSVIVVSFFLIEKLLSVLLYKLKIRKRPY